MVLPGEDGRFAVLSRLDAAGEYHDHGQFDDGVLGMASVIQRQVQLGKQGVALDWRNVWVED